MSTYREPGRMVDETEIERAKIHEAAETKREAIRQREETRRERINASKAYWSENGMGTGIVVAIGVVGLTIGSIWLGTEYLERRYGHGTCIDRGPTGTGQCTHPDHDLANNVCKCRRAVAPAASGAP